MRDAFGGAFMIKLFIVFIIIYVGFTAVALNYAKAFKAKNIVVEYLENNEISSIDMTATAETEMLNYFDKEIVGKLGYVFPNRLKNCNTKTTKCYEDIGIKIEQRSSSSKNKLGVYYRVTTYFGFQLPFFDRLFAISDSTGGNDLAGVWTIVGETRPIAFE